MNYKNSILIAALAFVFILPEAVHAVPAFARAHKISCNTCHSVFPRLKEYGDEFAGNGFIMKEDDSDRKYVKTGDDFLRLNKDFPIGGRWEAFVSHDGTSDVKNDFQVPWGIKILSGGTLAPNVGYYFYFYMSERGEVAGIEDAYIHFDNIRGTPLDIMLGQFQTSDPLMKRELRLTYEDYMIYKSNLGGMSNTNLAYDRGAMFVYGLEKTGTDLVAMLVNGNGKPEALNRRYDQDNHKNAGFRINQGIGSFSVGTFFYTGKEENDSAQVNEIVYFGPDFSFGMPFLEITGQYLYRSDSNIDFDGSTDDETETTGMILEAVLARDIERSRNYLTFLYNQIDSDYDPYQTVTLSYTRLMARNFRLVAEYTRDMELDENRFVFGFIGGF